MEDLTQTVNLQPAVTVINLACLAAIQNENLIPNVSAGHSLGEYSALHAAGVVSNENTFRLVYRRGKLMHREAGKKVGLVKITVYRPFPHIELLEALGESKCVVVMDRVASFGAWGSPTFSELRSALYGAKDAPQVINFIYGLGGRDTGPDQIEQAFAKGLEVAATGPAEKTVDYLGVRK